MEMEDILHFIIEIFKIILLFILMISIVLGIGYIASIFINDETSEKSFKLPANKVAVIPVSYDNSIIRAKVISVGRENRNNYLTAKIGDIVLYEKDIGSNVIINDENIVIMNESNVLAIIPKEK